MNFLDKIISIDKFKDLIHLELSQKIVFTNGCFDLIHLGHLNYLSSAKDLGDILVVGLNTDLSVRKLKGEERPIKDQKTRAGLLASLIFVDYVILFDQETPMELIREIKPNVLVKGGDYKVEDIVGYDEVISNGGEVLTLPFIEGYSTTQIIEKIKNL